MKLAVLLSGARKLGVSKIKRGWTESWANRTWWAAYAFRACDHLVVPVQFIRSVLQRSERRERQCLHFGQLVSELDYLVECRASPAPLDMHGSNGSVSQWCCLADCQGPDADS